MDADIGTLLNIQTDTDTGLQPLGFLQDSEAAQIIDENFAMPMGSSCNLHAQFFTHDIYESFKSKIIPDVFAAYCTESTFSFINASIKKNWAILKDIVLKHNKNVDVQKRVWAPNTRKTKTRRYNAIKTALCAAAHTGRESVDIN